MAALRLEPPEAFDFKSPDHWPQWRRRFEQCQSASALDKEDEARQVSALMYCMGETAADVLTSTNISAEDRKKYEPVMKKFDDFFSVRRNVILKRARFNRRNQMAGESAEAYITTLYSLVETCEYKAETVEEMLRDRLVVGMRDTALAERLQMDPELTLEKAKKAMRQKEAVKEKTQQLQGEREPRVSPLDAIKVDRQTTEKGWRPDCCRDNGWRQQNPPAFRRGRAASDKTVKPKCTRCGKGPHQADSRCPASTATCHRCNRKGHYQSQCFSKTRAHTDELTTDTVFLGAVVEKQNSPWQISALVDDKQVSFKLDTGAQVTAISEETYRALQPGPLKKPSEVLYGPTGQALNVIGQFTARIVVGSKMSKQIVFVVPGLRRNLMGLPAITSLHLACLLGEATTGADIKQQFPKVFTGLGNLGEDYCIKDAVPYSLYTPRNVAIPLREKVRKELERMEEAGVISKVTQPTQWCAGMVVVPKRSGDVRICVELKPLNESVLREVHPIPKVDETLAQLSGASVFSKLDANSGFWQIPLAKESRPLTTFITPFGRFCFNKLLFGISSAPELFQRRMGRLLEGLPGVLCLMDDIIVFGSNQSEHDAHLTAALKRLEAAGVTLNPQKCEFGKQTLRFLGHVVSSEGIRADPEKTSAIQAMPPPNSVSDLRRFLGMVNQMGKFSPNMAELSQPLRELLSTKRSWTWGPSQDRAFTLIKAELSKPTVLALYDPQANTKLSADASSFGLGAVLLQQVAEAWKPVAYASRSLSDTEKRYAQIEKEALALTWACEKFSTYLLGRRFAVETDHKPLVPLLSSKHLDDLPPRILWFRLRMARYDYSILHVPGKLLYTADTLSRIPASPDAKAAELEEEVEVYVDGVVETLPATEQRLHEYRDAQAQDNICSQVMRYCQTEWPGKDSIAPDELPYWKVRSSLTVHLGLLLYNHRIVVPKPLQKETMLRLHEGHQGIERCRMWAKTSVWWPGLSKELTKTVAQCTVCRKYFTMRREPLMTTPLPDYPWQVVGSDLFWLKGEQYLLVVDYFSRFPEVVKMSSTVSASIISVLKSLFARYGIPEVFRSDNGPQYSSEEFSRFLKSLGVRHVPSSPYYPQSNGLAERTVQTVKRLFKSSADPLLALLSYRATPLPWCNLSPAELLMGRRLRTTVPQTDKQLVPKWSFLPEFRRLNKEFKQHQKYNFDRRHRVQELPPISDEQDVWISTDGEPTPGTVVSSAPTPRSYIVETPTGQVHRNRSQLRVVPRTTQDQGPERQESDTRENAQDRQPSRIITRSQAGVQLKPPERLA